MATQKRGANQFQQQNQFGGDKRQRVQGESSQGQRQQPQQQRAPPQDRAPQQPNRPQGNQGQQQPRPQQQQPRDDGRVQCWDCGERGHVKRNCPRGNRQQTGGVTQGRMFAISQDNARVSDDVIEGRILLYDVWVGEYPKPSSFYQWEVFGTSNTYRKVLSAT
ncbi:zinc finger protein [Macleaya cordata]|uniref:Zinc finger protein n=1 Tax=Macleaya cordata TaxID=56857 RepID=A0A200PV58_MACCD|nr:zinc finger protein [Macleaya cordata]